MENDVLDIKELNSFLCNLFDLWEINKREPYILLFQEIIKGLKYIPPKYCKIAQRCMAFITIDSNGLLYSGCQRKEDMKIGNVSDTNHSNIIDRHRKNIETMNKRIKGKTIFEYLNTDQRFLYFQSKGCPNRLDGKGEDPYLPVYANLINHISTRLNIDIEPMIKKLKERRVANE